MPCPQLMLLSDYGVSPTLLNKDVKRKAPLGLSPLPSLLSLCLYFLISLT